jgi:hypothetical protein
MTQGAVMSCLKSFFLATFLLVSIYPTAFSAFSQNSQSVVAYPLGGAFCAKADDPSAIFINPAGISQLQSPEISMMYGVPYYGLPGISLQEGYLAAAMPIGKNFTVAVGGNNFNTNGDLVEQEGVLGLAWLAYDDLSIGANTTYLYHAYNIGDDALAKSDPVFAKGTSKGAIGFDLGARYQWYKFLALGASARHVNSPNVGLLSKDIVPAEYRFGADATYRDTSALFDVMIRDAGSDIADGRQVTWHLGVERVFCEMEGKYLENIHYRSKELIHYYDTHLQYMSAHEPTQHRFAVRLGANDTEITD